METRARSNMEALEAKIDKILNSMVSKDDLKNELKKVIEEQNKIIQAQVVQIEKLEKKVVTLEKEVSDIKSITESNEQYNRRFCLRIVGIPTAVKEDADNCLLKVKNVLKDLEIPDNLFDRVHRIGKKKVINGKTHQTMIVRFTTWRHRTIVYRKRKSIENVRIYLDLTKTRLDVLNEANEIIKNVSQAEFAFADVNCRLTVKLRNNRYEYFNSITKLKDILNK